MSEEKKKVAPKRSKYIALVLYPEEDMKHKTVMDYIIKNRVLYPEVLWITHDKDIDSEEEFSDDSSGHDFVLPLHKAHVHLFAELNQPITASGFLKRFLLKFNGVEVPYISFVQLVSDPVAYIQYMVHLDFKSSNDPTKFKYPFSDLQGSPKLMSLGFEENSVKTNWEVLKNMYDFIRSRGLSDFLLSASRLQDKESYQLWTVYRANQSIALKADQAFIYNNCTVGGFKDAERQSL